jgi:hypothetical protein
MEPDELHEMLMFLNEELTAGRIKLSSQFTVDALARVRFGSDGKVDPSTVDGSVRALARAALGAKYQRDVREMPLRDVQSRYFDILDGSFGGIFEEAKRKGATPQNVADAISSNESMLSAFNASVSDFAAGLTEFWEVHGPVVEAHLTDLKSLKSVFGGDVFPSYTSNIACSVGLYMDTVVLPDPLTRLLTMRAGIAPKQLFRLVIKHALNALGYRELALADVNPPIVVIAPDRFGLDTGYSRAVNVAGNTDALIHASRIFGRDFENVPELIDFVTGSGDPNQIVANMADPHRLIFDGEWSEPLPEQIIRYVNENIQTVSTAKGYGEAVYYSILGRMMMVNDTLLRSSGCDGSPLIDAPTSWKYLQWKYEYDAIVGHEAEQKSGVLISKALGSSLLSGLPPETMIELRRNGAATELRAMIGNGISEINSASDADVSMVADAVIANVDNAFSEHNKQLQALSHSRIKFYGKDVGRYVINGGLLLTSYLNKSPALGALSTLVAISQQFLGNPGPDDLMKRYRELRSKSADLRRSPVGAMFQHLKGKFGFSP